MSYIPPISPGIQVKDVQLILLIHLSQGRRGRSNVRLFRGANVMQNLYENSALMGKAGSFLFYFWRSYGLYMYDDVHIHVISGRMQKLVFTAYIASQ